MNRCTTWRNIRKSNGFIRSTNKFFLKAKNHIALWLTKANIIILLGEQKRVLKSIYMWAQCFRNSSKQSIDYYSSEPNHGKDFKVSRIHHNLLAVNSLYVSSNTSFGVQPFTLGILCL